MDRGAWWATVYGVPKSQTRLSMDAMLWVTVRIRLLLLYCYCSFSKSCSTLWDTMDCSTSDSFILHYLPQFSQIHVRRVSVMLSNHLILCHPLFLLSSIFPSIKVFYHESTLHIRWPKCWSFSFSISPPSEYSGLISFRTGWIDPVVRGTLKSLLQHHSLKASILQHSAFFMVQLSHLYMTTGKSIALIAWNFVNKVTSLLFNVLSTFVIAFLPGSKHLLNSWLKSPSTVILEPTKIKYVTISTFSPSICHEIMEPDALILVLFSF